MVDHTRRRRFLDRVLFYRIYYIHYISDSSVLATMRSMQSTQIQFGGFIINSEDDAAIIHHITRLIAAAADTLSCVSEICHLLFVLIPMMIEVCHRVLFALDVIEATWQAIKEMPELFKPRLGYAPG